MSFIRRKLLNLFLISALITLASVESNAGSVVDTIFPKKNISVDATISSIDDEILKISKQISTLYYDEVPAIYRKIIATEGSLQMARFKLNSRLSPIKKDEIQKEISHLLIVKSDLISEQRSLSLALTDSSRRIQSLRKLRMEILITAQAELRNKIKNYNSIFFGERLFSLYDSALGMWSVQGSQMLKSYSVRLDIKNDSTGPESNLGQIIQTAIGGDYVGVGFSYDGSFIDPITKKSSKNKKILLRRWFANSFPENYLTFQNIALNRLSSDLSSIRGFYRSSERLRQRFIFKSAEYLSSISDSILPPSVNLTTAANVELQLDFDWKPGSYVLTINLVGEESDGSWYRFELKDASGFVTHLGDLKFPKGDQIKNNNGIDSVGISYNFLNNMDYLKSNNLQVGCFEWSLSESQGIDLSGKMVDLNVYKSDRGSFATYNSLGRGIKKSVTFHNGQQNCLINRK